MQNHLRNDLVTSFALTFLSKWLLYLKDGVGDDDGGNVDEAEEVEEEEEEEEEEEGNGEDKDEDEETDKNEEVGDCERTDMMRCSSCEGLWLAETPIGTLITADLLFLLRFELRMYAKDCHLVNIQIILKRRRDFISLRRFSCVFVHSRSLSNASDSLFLL
jgi:hypothetical protein